MTEKKFEAMKNIRFDIYVPKIQQVNEVADIPYEMARVGVPYYSMECINWPDSHPYKPQVHFAIAHSGDNIYIHYKVKEQSVRAAGVHDKAHVWEDSCVEFFCASGDDNRYINLEANCIGYIYSCIGPDRNNRKFISDESYAAIRRWSSLIGQIVPERKQETEWELALIVPSNIYGIENLSGKTLRGNFYKCGDLLSVQHFVSWAPIVTPKPDFHRPEYFIKLAFE